MGKDFNYRELEQQYGKMFHLLLPKSNEEKGVKFVSDHNYPKFASIDSLPVFFNDDKEFCLATSFVIIYPKVYVTKFIKLKKEDLPLEISYIH